MPVDVLHIPEHLWPLDATLYAWLYATRLAVFVTLIAGLKPSLFGTHRVPSLFR